MQKATWSETKRAQQMTGRANLVWFCGTVDCWISGLYAPLHQWCSNWDPQLQDAKFKILVVILRHSGHIVWPTVHGKSQPYAFLRHVRCMCAEKCTLLWLVIVSNLPSEDNLAREHFIGLVYDGGGKNMFFIAYLGVTFELKRHSPIPMSERWL